MNISRVSAKAKRVMLWDQNSNIIVYFPYSKFSQLHKRHKHWCSVKSIKNYVEKEALKLYVTNNKKYGDKGRVKSHNNLSQQPRFGIKPRENENQSIITIKDENTRDLQVLPQQPYPNTKLMRLYHGHCQTSLSEIWLNYQVKYNVKPRSPIWSVPR